MTIYDVAIINPRISCTMYTSDVHWWYKIKGPLQELGLIFLMVLCFWTAFAMLHFSLQAA